MPARKTAELLLQVGRLVQAEGYDGELSPAQWMALRYFARANCSAFQSSQRTRVFSAFIFSQRASTAMADIVNSTAICWKDN